MTDYLTMHSANKLICFKLMNSKFVIRQEELFEVVHFMKAPLGARTICIPINKSKQSQNAVDFALKRILKPTDNLILLNCRTISDSIFFCILILTN